MFCEKIPTLYSDNNKTHKKNSYPENSDTKSDYRKKILDY